MQVYYAPFACSAATRIALEEAGAAAEFIYVDIHTSPRARWVADGSDYHAINPMGQVPAIRTQEGEIITENPAVLQYVADRYPDAKLAPAGGLGRYRLQQWLNFIATELHKATYIPLLVRNSPEGAKAFAREKLPKRLAYLSGHLESREFLLDGFTVADAYLIAVLNWSAFAGIDLSEWPRVHAWFHRICKRPSVAMALAKEAAAYADEQSRRVG